MSVIILTGAPATGKSTICRQISEYHNNLECLNFGGFLSDYLKAGNDEKYCDDAFINYILRRKKNIIIDSHGVERNDYGIKFTPFTGIGKLLLSALVLLKSEPEKILERRTRDSKIRFIETIQEIEEHQRLLETELIANSCRLEVHGFIIYNNNAVEEATQKLEKILNDVGIPA